MLLSKLLEGNITAGRLTIIDATGKIHRFGAADASPGSTIRFHDKSLHYKMFLNPELYLGEAYMNGTLTIEEGTLSDFLHVCVMNFRAMRTNTAYRITAKFSFLFMRLQHFNSVARAKQHVAPHYDDTDAITEMFLDPDLQYTCAYYDTPNASLEHAQEAKKKHIAAKLLLKPGNSVLEMGCGWGGFALYLSRIADVDVVGVTLSKRQYETAVNRAAAAGMSDRVTFHCRDFREQTGRYDRVVAVGLLEHLGARFYPELFDKAYEVLEDDGVALIHAIGASDVPRATNPWIRKYIFPGGYVPALSEVLPAIEKAGLIVTDIEILRLHYAETLKHWSERFARNRSKIVELHGERYCRMFEFYLIICEMGFRYMGHMVFQIQLTKRIDTVPLTRDYIADWKGTNTRGAAVA